jgi:hypothetical protein
MEDVANGLGDGLSFAKVLALDDGVRNVLREALL